MPGIFPRLKDLLFSGFGPVTRLVAVICFMAGLLPRNHACFKAETKSQYGLIKILAAAANNITFEWKQIDKIIIFGLMTCGTVMMGLYLLGLVLFIITSPAFALGVAITDIFTTEYPDRDVAFMMLDRTFGIPDLYNSCVSAGATDCFDTDTPPDAIPFPSPFQIALQNLFAFFSMGIFFIALTIFLYHIVHFILEVTQTGHVADHLSDDVMAPYADSPSKGFTWLPIRFVVCFGLLLPFGEGLNSAQWITLYTAKYGSGLATNAWINFNAITGDNPTGNENVHLITQPSPPDSTGLIKSLLLMKSCKAMNDWEYNIGGKGSKDVTAYVVSGGLSRPVFTRTYANPGLTGFMDDNQGNMAENTYPSDPAEIVTQSGGIFTDILTFSGKGDIRIVLGEFLEDDPQKYESYPGKILPVCGEITIPVTGQTGEALLASEGYFFAVMNILFDLNRPGVGRTDEERALFAATMREYYRSSSLVQKWACSTYPGCTIPQPVLDSYLCGPTDILGPCKEPVMASYWSTMMNDYYGFAFSVPPYTAYDFLAGVDTAGQDVDPDNYYTIDPSAWDAIGVDNPLLLSTGILEYGWGGAGLWYNKISERNGSLYTAVASLPIVNKYPLVMEQIKTARKSTDSSTGNTFCENFNPRKSGTTATNNPNEKNTFEVEEAGALHALCTQMYENQGIIINGVTRAIPASNPIESTIQSIFSEFKLFNPQSNYEVTPMAQLSSLGRLLIDKSILGVVSATAASAYGGMAHMTATKNGQGADMFAEAAGAFSTAVMTISMIGLSSGLVLHYMLPFMPFMYFFFAVGRWVKAIFEAMVGVPLWALAHMRVGGPGLPGDAASSGYFLLLEIFIRPILIVFSLVAAFTFFGALVSGLNTLFTLISANLFGGVDPGQLLTEINTGTVTNGVQNAVQLTRGVVDQFFLSAFYVMLCYTIGTGAFKMIDLLPDNILRWAGAGVRQVGLAADTADNMIDEWQWQLPHRMKGTMESIGGGIHKELYGKPAAEHKQAMAEKKAKEEMEKQGAAARGQDGEASPG